jgi:hypothetical protein
MEYQIPTYKNEARQALRSDELPRELLDILSKCTDTDVEQIAANMRPAEVCTDPIALNSMKATRLSFGRRLAQRMISENWSVTRTSFESDELGNARGVYEINLGGLPTTYIVRSFAPDGIQRFGRRSGALRDVYGALFARKLSQERIDREFKVIETRDVAVMRTTADVVGWTPGSRSGRVFDDVVSALAEGHQPADEVIRRSGYLIRNGGFITGGRFGTWSYAGIPDEHPLKPAYFADLFGVLLLRQVGFDLTDAMAAARNPNAAKLAPRLRRYFGVGNASGQGMCVALQRWPQWFSTWVTVREVCLAHARLQPVHRSEKVDALRRLIDRAAHYYHFVEPESEQFIIPHLQIAEGLTTIMGWLDDIPDLPPGTNWGHFMDRAAAELDRETYEQLNALLIEIYPHVADAVAEYVDTGMQMRRDFSPELSVGEFRSQFLSKYRWFLLQDLTHSDARRHFWYHSIENGEQRRGERVIDPHEHFESFIDHIGGVQRLASALAAYPDDTPLAIVAADSPDLAFMLSRVQSLAGRPYFEIHGNLLHKDFSPAYLIRFFLSVLGMDSSSPLSIRYVPGVFFQGLPVWEDISAGADADWTFAKMLEVEAQ